MASKRGFGLVEMLVYTAILAAVSVFVVDNILIILKSFNNYQLTRYINSAGTAAMERMMREIRLADSINESASVFGANPGRLALITIDPDTEAATTIDFYVSADSLVVKEDGNSAVSLTPYNVQLTNLVFRKVASNPHSSAVKIEMTIKSQRGNYQKTVNFYDTAVLRRSYK